MTEPEPIQQLMSMMQFMAKALEKSERNREQSILDLRAHFTAETDRLTHALTAQVRHDATLALFRDLLPALDEIDEVLRLSRPDAVGAGALAAVRRRLRDTFGRMGIVEITGIERGTPFDPELHDAVPCADDEVGDLPSSAVVAVARAGYRAGEHLIRAPRVTITP